MFTQQLGIGMRFFKLMACALLLFSTPIWANDPWNENVPDQYIVKKGDTLWGISELFLADPWLWPEIWHANQQIENPHLIYPGDVVKLIYVDGKRMITVEPGPGRGVDVSDPDSETSKQLMNDGTLKLSPKARVSLIDSVIPAIPLEAIQGFINDNRVLDREEMDAAPYVIAGENQRILVGVGDSLYARDPFDKFSADHKTYGIFRAGDAYFDPDTEEMLGFQALDLGLAKKIRVSDDVATLKLLSTNQEVRIGDRLLPTLERKLSSVFFPKSPDALIEGKIIHVFSGVRNVSHFDVVVVNKGEREQLQVGDVLAVFSQGETVRDTYTNELIKLPDERSGLMIIFRTFDKVSYGLILKAEKVLKVSDVVKNP